jgi:hypothetical protein
VWDLCARYSDRRERTEEAPGEKDVDIIGLEMGGLEMGGLEMG